MRDRDQQQGRRCHQAHQFVGDRFQAASKRSLSFELSWMRLSTRATPGNLRRRCCSASLRSPAPMTLPSSRAIAGDGRADVAQRIDRAQAPVEALAGRRVAGGDAARPGRAARRRRRVRRRSDGNSRSAISRQAMRRGMCDSDAVGRSPSLQLRLDRQHERSRRTSPSAAASSTSRRCSAWSACRSCSNTSVMRSAKAGS